MQDTWAGFSQKVILQLSVQKVPVCMQLWTVHNASPPCRAFWEVERQLVRTWLRERSFWRLKPVSDLLCNEGKEKFTLLSLSKLFSFEVFFFKFWAHMNIHQQTRGNAGKEQPSNKLFFLFPKCCIKRAICQKDLEITACARPHSPLHHCWEIDLSFLAWIWQIAGWSGDAIRYCVQRSSRSRIP